MSDRSHHSRPRRGQPQRDGVRSGKGERPREGDPRRHRSDDEQKFHGRPACHAIFNVRPQDIIRVYVDHERVKEFSELLKWCAEQRRAYHVVEAENLERLAETVHHQGIVVLARKRTDLTDVELLSAVRAGRIASVLLYLDGVQNPHNLGAILRTSAHFGVGAVLGQRDQLPGVTASAARVAEGGAEAVPLARLHDPQATLAELKSLGYRLYSTAVEQGGNVYTADLSSRAVIILGNEVHGVSPDIAALADQSLLIPGTGAVESLNVGAACAVLLSEVARRAVQPAAVAPKTPPVGPGSPARGPFRKSRGKSRRFR